MYKIRRHLANGPHKGFWQVRSDSGTVEYYPSGTTIGVFNATLINYKGTAEKINQETNKEVCAWVECERYSVVHSEVTNYGKIEIVYDPKKLPYWHSGLNNSDGAKFKSGNLTNGKFYV
jgi:hypothetical protein